MAASQNQDLSTRGAGRYIPGTTETHTSGHPSTLWRNGVLLRQVFRTGTRSICGSSWPSGTSRCTREGLLLPCSPPKLANHPIQRTEYAAHIPVQVVDPRPARRRALIGALDTKMNIIVNHYRHLQ
jgi:hypothetical protein